jgi:hypothetical protein
MQGRYHYCDWSIGKVELWGKKVQMYPPGYSDGQKLGVFAISWLKYRLTTKPSDIYKGSLLLRRLKTVFSSIAGL